MKALAKYWTVRIAVMLCAIGLIVTGCASTKNVMNKATFGLVGGEKSDESSADATKETKAERKAREKEAKQQREAEKRAAKEDEKARKAAAKEEKQNEEKPGMMSRMTFGLVGGEKKPKAEKQIEADTKSAEKDAEKDQKRRDKEAREQEKREAKALERQQEQEAEAQKKEEKRAAKERKEQEKAEAKAAKAEEQSEPKATEEETGGKRTLMSRMTFGLVGGKKSETTTTSTASTTSDVSTTATATMSTTSSPPPSEERTKEDKKAQKRAEKEQREAEKQAKKDAEKAEKEAAKQAEAEEGQSEEATSEEQPKEKKTLMSRMTFGLVGGKKSDEPDSADQSASSTESATSTEPEQPALPPEQIAMAAPADVQYDVQPASALSGDAQKLAKMPFKTTLDYSTKSSTGKGQATATRETYSKSGYGITDLGDVRIAVEGMTFNDESRGGGVIISSDDRLAAGGKSGSGNSLFNYEYAKGVSAVQFGTVSFTIANSVVRIGEKSVPIGQGKKLIVLDGQGNLIGAYSIE